MMLSLLLPSFLVIAFFVDSSLGQLCQEWQGSVILAEDIAIFDYKVIMPAGGPAYMTGRMEYAGEAWLSIGFSPDDKGKMAGSEAVIGLPLEPISPSNPGKYHMVGDGNDDVFLMDDARQTIMDGSISQVDGITELIFSKILSEEEEIEILTGMEMTFVWAFGFENVLGLHDKKEGAGDFALILNPCIEQSQALSNTTSTSEPTMAAASPTPEPTMAAASPEPTMEGTLSTDETNATEQPDSTSEPVEELEEQDEMNATEQPDSTSEPVDELDEQVINCETDYQETISIMTGLALSYAIRTDENGTETFSGMLEYDGEAYISIGWAEDSQGKMIGGESIIALPDEPVSQSNPGKYHMVSETNAGVFLMDTVQQTLVAGDIVQEDGKTIMTFTKNLAEPGEIEILGSGQNTFIWAIGFSNTLQLHKHTGAFTLALSPCVNGNVAEVASVTKLEGFTFEQREVMWLAHGLLGVAAWAVLAPAAVTTSWLRGFFGQSWFKIHFYANIAVLLCTIGAFGLAVVLYEDSDDSHFAGSHQAVGLAITILVVLQSAAGILRPSAPKQPDAPKEQASIADATTSPPAPPTVPVERIIWQTGHKLLGLYMLFLGFWQVQDGIVLYTQKYNVSTSYEYGFWVYVGAFMLLVFALAAKTRLREAGMS